MQGIEYIYELCEPLPRSGPGDNASTRRAWSAIPHSQKPPHILDIGCGQGMQTIELAKLSNGKIIAIDNHQGFLDILLHNAIKHGVESSITTRNVSMLDMDFKDESFDIIWSEGALYIMGFQNGLMRCHKLLKPDGYLAVTELVYTASTPPTDISQYLESEYPEIKTIEANVELVKQAGFRLVSNFTLSESAWLDNYYLPMEQVIPRLRQKYQGNKTAQAVFDSFNREIDMYKQYSAFYGYEFFVMQKQ